MKSNDNIFNNVNAIILAAGIGNRLKPETNSTPKPLTSINSIPIIETQIIYLKEAGVKNIYIVVGYKKEQFGYLIEKYENIFLIENDLYNITNNIYSLFLCRNHLQNTWIIEGDIYLRKNIFKIQYDCFYITALKPLINNEWIFDLFYDNKVLKIIVKKIENKENNNLSKFYLLSGISFWSSAYSKLIADSLCRRFSDKKKFEVNRMLYWDQIIYENIKSFDLFAQITDENDWFEIDTIWDLNHLNNLIENN